MAWKFLIFLFERFISLFRLDVTLFLVGMIWKYASSCGLMWKTKMLYLIWLTPLAEERLKKIWSLPVTMKDLKKYSNGSKFEIGLDTLF